MTILPVTSELRPTPLFRIAISPTAINQLSKPSQVIVDKAQTAAREKIGAVFGRLEDKTIVAVTSARADFFGIA